MLKNKSKLFLILMLVLTLALSPLSFADNETAEDTANAASVEEQAVEQVTDNLSQANTAKSGDQYLIGDNITVDYIVDGNVFIMAQEVTIKSQIVGNAFIMANKVTLTEEGYIGASFYALGENVEVNGVTFDSYIVSNNLAVSGYVYRDIHAACKNFNLYGAVGRDASVAAENFNFKKSEEDEKTGKIMGNLYYTSDNGLELSEGIVAGEARFEQSKEINFRPNYVFLAVSSVIFVLLVWGLFKWLAPKFEEKADNLISNKPFKTLGVGALAFFALPIASVLLMITGVAASAGLLVLSAYLILVCIARAVSVIAINNIIAKKVKFDTTSKKFLLLIATSLVIWVITLIPYVWLLTNIILEFIGFGIIWRNLLDKEKEEETK